ncbi:hypothetical protein [Mycobacterium tuberculosis]|uniref:hypothetical protein n=1 Tax=Mycobacterium tuberculosis TaxID=1773 RepID=UPI00272BEC89|nr:hypothetical protein [Mycobacterium tuberculosis]
MNFTSSYVDKLLDACERKLGLKFCVADQHTVLIDNAADLFGEIVATNHKDEFHVVLRVDILNDYKF